MIALLSLICVARCAALPAGARVQVGPVTSVARRIASAIRSDDVAKVKVLVTNRRLANSYVGRTPILNLALSLGRVAACKILLHRGADPMKPGSRGTTAMEAAVLADSLAECKLLLPWHKLFNAQDSGGDTPLHFAESLPVLKFLLCHGANPVRQDHDGVEPLHNFADVGLPRLVDYLLRHTHQDVNARDKFGNTPLIYVCSHSQHSANSPRTPDDLVVAKELISAGADPEMRNRRGESACKLASEGGWADMLAVLHCKGSR